MPTGLGWVRIGLGSSRVPVWLERPEAGAARRHATHYTFDVAELNGRLGARRRNAVRGALRL